MADGCGTLYIIATPIGNLADWSFRAADTAKRVAVIACEDTRVTRHLLQHYSINTPTLAYHEHNAARQRPKLLERLQWGEDVALVSDAGTPLISDPGYKLVREARALGIPVCPIPGASGVMAALSVAGLPTDRFLFVGFLPAKAGARAEAIREVKPIRATLIFFESARRITGLLKELTEMLGDRECVLCREMTKRHEEIIAATLATMAAHLGEENTRGEMVLLVAPPDEVQPAADIAADRLLEVLLRAHGSSEAAKMAAEITGLPRSELYRLALSLKSEGG